jgi:hypothetical protein
MIVLLTLVAGGDIRECLWSSGPVFQEMRHRGDPSKPDLRPSKKGFKTWRASRRLTWWAFSDKNTQKIQEAK